jgi:predicted nucleic acid-binding protein
LVADTTRGRRLRALAPDEAVPWMPEIFSAECGAVLRRWDLARVLSTERTATAVDELLAWPLRIAQVRPLFADAWRLRANVTVPDAIYVALAEHLGASLLTDDHRLANAPKLFIQALRLPPRA